MNNQFGSYFFQLNDTFICIHYLLKKNLLLAQKGKWMVFVKILEKGNQFFNFPITGYGRTYKNTSCKITSPWNKT